MQDDLERTGESASAGSVSEASPAKLRLEMLDVEGAIHAAERAAGTKIVDQISVASRDQRVSVIATTERIAGMRDAMREVAASRVGLVVHALAGTGAEDLAAFADLGWGVLSSSGPEDWFDLTLVARRAAEDSGVPFLVVHGLARKDSIAGRAIAMTGLPSDAAVEAFVGAAPRNRADAAPAGDRAFAERAPFALGAALREYGSVSGRRHDVFDKVPLGESPLVLVGTGPVGDALLSATTELRARGFDVGAVNVTSLRPFPGPRLVKALARALAITVLEPSDEPFAHGGFLARHVKAAFTDALTWTPGYPGIGRIPKLFVGASGAAFDLQDLAAVCENMLADERGHRVFSFIDVERSLPRTRASIAPAPTEQRTEREIAIRFVLDDSASAEAVLRAVGKVLAEGVGLRAHGIIAGATLDLVATRDSARGGMARRAPRLVLATSKGITSAGAVVALAEGAVLGVLGGELPPAARTVVRERRVRALPLADDSVATCCGAALAVAVRLTKSHVESAGSVIAAALGTDSASPAQRAFDATHEALANGAA